MTLHSAAKPQTPGQGSMHFWLEQALSLGQSALIVHSGLQPPSVGVPWKPGKHSQTAFPFNGLQMVFIPHGDGLQGFTGSTTIWNKVL